MPPNYASYKMAQAILGVKAAYEKAQKAGAATPEPGADHRRVREPHVRGAGRPREDGARQGPSGRHGRAVGTAKNDGGQLKIVDVVRYPAEKVNPPDGVKSEAWIKSGFKAK